MANFNQLYSTTVCSAIRQFPVIKLGHLKSTTLKHIMKEHNYPIQHKHRSHDNINYILKFRCFQLSEFIMFSCLCVASCLMPYGCLYVVANDFIYLLQQIIGCRGRLVESRNTSIKYILLQFTFYILISIFSPHTITTITTLITRKDHCYHSSSSECHHYHPSELVPAI